MIYNSILETIGNTPLVRLSNLIKKYDLKCDILAKVESFNPASSVKDRVALNMVKAAIADGKLTPSTTIIEPTSGNTGVGLAMVASSLGYKLILTMPESMSIERRKLLSLLGAKIVLTPKEKGMQGAVDEALRLSSEINPSWIPSQFDNQNNLLAHKNSTAAEIWEATKGEVDIFISCFGTGGTVSGCGEKLKELAADENRQIKVIGVEPSQSPLLSKGIAGPHKIQGIGANFVPSILNKNVIDEIKTVDENAAISMVCEIAKTEGILIGISSGAAIAASLEIAAQPQNVGKKIVVILPDSAERYLSMLPIDA